MSSPILIYRFGQLGDTLAAVPAFWALRRAFPEARLDLLHDEPAATFVAPAEILPPTGLIDRYLTYPTKRKGRGLGDILRLASRLRAARYNLLVYFAPHTSDKPRLASRDLLFFRFLVGIRRVIGQEGDTPLPANRSPPLPEIENQSARLLNRLRAGGLAVPDLCDARKDLGLTENERDWASAWWRERGVSDAGQLRRHVVVAPGAKWPSKIWPEARFSELGRRLRDGLGLTPVVVGGAQDVEVGQRLLALWGGGILAAGSMSVRRSAAVMEGLAFFVGNDSGAMHLAAAAGLRCVGIFSAQDWPGRWSPVGEGHRILRVSLPCEGCLLSVCPKNNACLEAITVDHVFAAAQASVPRPAA